MIVYYLFLIIIAIVYTGMFGKRPAMSERLIEVRNKRYAFFLILGLACIWGLRAPTVGVDTEQYLYRYENYRYMLGSQAYKSEFGFNWLNYFFNVIGVKWQLYLFILSLIIALAIIHYFKLYSDGLLFPTFLFVTIGTFTFMMSGLRQSLAIALCLSSIVTFENNAQNKRKKTAYLIAILLWLIAITIHNSAVVFVLYFFIRKFRVSKSSLWVALAFSVLSIVYGRLFIPLISLIMPKRYIGISLDAGYAINPLVILVATAIPVYSLVLARPQEDGKLSQVDSCLFLCSVLAVFFTCMSVNNNQIGRLVYYFSNANVILIPNCTKRFRHDSRPIAIIIIVLVCSLYFYIVSAGGTLRIDTYKFFWQY